MAVILRPILEVSVILPGMLLAYLPMKHYFRIHLGKLAAIVIPSLIALCVIDGGLCHFLNIKTIWTLFPVVAIAGAIYLSTLSITRWKSVSVFFAVCGAFCYLGSIAWIIDVTIWPDNATPWFSLQTGLLYNAICWGFVAVFWYPATHGAKSLLDADTFAQTWYVFWILPLAFIGLNLFIRPIHKEFLHQGRAMQLYTIVILALLILLLLFYLLFYIIANNLNKNDRLRQENQFLSMQQTQYDSLRTAIAETRQARHDMRHHFSTLSNLAKREEWENLKAYLATAQESIPDAELSLCDNPAVDGIVSHYGMLCRKNEIPCHMELDLPPVLPIPEIDLCLVLSNLLENALEASLRTAVSNRHIHVQAYLHSKSVMLLTVKNTFDGTIRQKNNIFQSSKRHGNGIGIESVRHIAEKNGGYSQFTYQNGIFRANVMLRGA